MCEIGGPPVLEPPLSKRGTRKETGMTKPDEIQAKEAIVRITMISQGERGAGGVGHLQKGRSET